VSLKATPISRTFARHYGELVTAVNLGLHEEPRSGRGQRTVEGAAFDTAQVFAVDLFAGAGGASTGIQWATGESPQIAINHCVHAIEMHGINHPETTHYCRKIEDLDPAKLCKGVSPDVLWASPDCTQFSRLTGGRIKDRDLRWLAMQLLAWIEAVRPAILFIENVEGFTKWGPEDSKGRVIESRRGERFKMFLRKIREAGYDVEYRKLRGSSFGAPTDRERLFIVARSDGKPIVWPEPTHGPGKKALIPAAKCVDWKIPTPSIFVGRRVVNPHAKARGGPFTPPLHMRITAGVQRYVAHKPRIRKIGKTHTVPFLMTTGYGENVGQKPRILDLYSPLGTIVAGGKKHALVFASLGPRPNPKVESFLRKGAKIGKLGYQDTYPTVRVGGRELYITDLGYRQLMVDELIICQGLPKDYVILGSETTRLARLGNTVVPQLVEALVDAQLA
jgi:DNA (cytosine-5)-methyltransferase 1